MTGAELKSERSSAFKAAILVMMATALSRVLGYAREVVVAAYYGTSYQIDAYRVAIQLPNLFRLVLGDVVVAAAFVPIFSSYLARNQEKEGWKIASKILTLTVLILLLVTLIGEIFAGPMIRVLAPGFEAKPDTFKLSVSLTRIMFPALIFMALAGLFSGLLNSYEIFLLPALSPTVWNVIIITSIVAFSQSYGIYAFATGLLVASVVQALIQIPAFKDRVKMFALDFDFRHPEVKNFFLLLIPIIISSATSNINTIVDTRFASYLKTGVISALGYAVRIYLVPAGVFGVAVSTVLFPRLVKYEALNDEAAFVRSLSFGLRVLTFIMMPVAAFFVFFALPIVRMLFERGSFGYSDSLLTAAALSMYSVGVVSYAQTLLLNRAYYSKKDSKTPLYVATASIIVNYFGDWFLMRKMPLIPSYLPLLSNLRWVFQPHAGIALSTSLVSIFQFTVLYALYTKKFGKLDTASFLKTSALSSVLTAVSAGFGVWVYNLIAHQTISGLLMALVAVLITGFVAYTLLAFALKMEETKYVVEILKERFRKS